MPSAAFVKAASSGADVVRREGRAEDPADEWPFARAAAVRRELQRGPGLRTARCTSGLVSCITRPGANACPPEFPKRSTAGSAADESKACVGCVCGAPTACTGGSVSLYDGSMCRTNGSSHGAVDIASGCAATSDASFTAMHLRSPRLPTGGCAAQPTDAADAWHVVLHGLAYRLLQVIRRAGLRARLARTIEADVSRNGCDPRPASRSSRRCNSLSNVRRIGCFVPVRPPGFAARRNEYACTLESSAPDFCSPAAGIERVWAVPER